MHGIFGEISLVIVLAGLLGIIMHLLKQPALVGYVLTGLIVGPLGYLHLNNSDIINSLSEIGITLLLFMVGLELSMRDLKQVGWVVGIVGFLQIAIMAALGTTIFTAFGLPLTAAVYLGLGIGVSSTIVAVKVLSEKKDLDSLYGKLVLGILIVEDIISILALTFITGFGSGPVTLASVAPLAIVLGKLAVLFVLAIVASTKIFPWVVEKLSKSSELIFLFSLAWGLGFATLISAELFGLTPEIGGFLAGLTLANSSMHLHISSRMKPIRDFFLILFFIVLGSQLVIQDIGQMIFAALGIAFLGVAIKPIFTFILLTMFGYKGRTSFLTASSLAHISEFSIILAVLGNRAGHLSQDILSLITMSTILSFLGATYLGTHNAAIARTFRRFLAWWDPRSKSREDLVKTGSLRGHIVLVGAHRAGLSVIHSLEELKKKFLVIDYNPEIVRKLKRDEIKVLFGDIADPEIQDKANFEKAKMIISTVPDYQDNLGLIAAARIENPKIKLIVSANNELEAQELYKRGADYVLLPHFLGGLQLAQILRNDISLRHIDKLKQRDLHLLGETG